MTIDRCPSCGGTVHGPAGCADCGWSEAASDARPCPAWMAQAKRAEAFSALMNRIDREAARTLRCTCAGIDDGLHSRHCDLRMHEGVL